MSPQVRMIKREEKEMFVVLKRLLSERGHFEGWVSFEVLHRAQSVLELYEERWGTELAKLKGSDEI